MLDRVNCGVRPGEVDSSCLDCIDVNLATLLLHFGMNPVRPLFACQWYFEFDESSKDGLPVLRSVPLGHILETYAGYAIRKIPFEAGTCLPVLREHLDAGQPLLVIGDAFLMPWLPYFGREHMAHSFIVNGFDRCEQAVLIVDNYYNRTVWGDAVPLETTLPASEIEPIARSLPEAPLSGISILEKVGQGRDLGATQWLAKNARGIQYQVGENESIRRFATYYESMAADLVHAERFTLACWMITRARTLHGLWLADLKESAPEIASPVEAEAFQAGIVEPWQRVSEFAYVMLRRVSNGRTPPTSCFRMIHDSVHPNELAFADRIAENLSPLPN